jgi:hypothetical protein
VTEGWPHRDSGDARLHASASLPTQALVVLAFTQAIGVIKAEPSASVRHGVALSMNSFTRTATLTSQMLAATPIGP